MNVEELSVEIPASESSVEPKESENYSMFSDSSIQSDNGGSQIYRSLHTKSKPFPIRGK